MRVWMSVGWGLFLATSWTWCIGMYLPRVLIDRFGIPGFLAFAVPNVLGVVAMGFVLRNRGASEAMIARHGSAMRWFSIATLAFHIFFLLALPSLGALPFETASAEAAYMAVVAVGAGLAMSRVPLPVLPAVAALFWGASMVVFVELGEVWPDATPWAGALPPSGITFLAPVLLLGFVLCPYFDLTFHRALRQGGGVGAFAAFAPAFTMMLLLTVGVWATEPVSWSLALGHLYWQSAITIALHVRELQEERGRFSASEMTGLAGLPIGAVLVALVAAFMEHEAESFYLRFLVFYGLVFPAYALGFIWPGHADPRSRKALVRLLIVIAAMIPFYELGFIHGRTEALLVPALAAIGWCAFAWWRRRRSLIAQRTSA